MCVCVCVCVCVYVCVHDSNLFGKLLILKYFILSLDPQKNYIYIYNFLL